MEQKNILVIGFNAGGNPFCPVYSRLEDFELPDPGAQFENDAACRWMKSQGFRIVPAFLARARGRMTLETYKILVTKLFESIPDGLAVDGVYLQIGGGMLVDFIGNGDAFFVSQLRERVGWNVPIAAPMDFHGGMPHTLMKALNIITTFRTNPHVDVAETQMRAARLLVRAIKERVTPVNIAIRIPMVVADSMKQEAGAGAVVNGVLERLETVEGVWSASLMTGSAWSNCSSTGSLLVLSCEKPSEMLYKAMALSAMDIWNVRGDYIPMNTVVSPEEAFILADRVLSQGGSGPVFIDDSGDNPTNSATGDSAYMLELALRLKQRSCLFAGIWDADFVDKCAGAPVHAWICGEIGASVCTSGTRILVRGRIDGFRKDNRGNITGVKVFIPTVRAEAEMLSDGVMVLVTKQREGVLNRAFMGSFGEDCMDYGKVVVKLGYLLDDFLEIATDVFMARSPGNVDLDFGRINASMDKIPRPMYPFDEDVEFCPMVIR